MTETPQPSSEPPRLTVTEVAHRLGKRYLRARDLVLQGRLGKVLREGRTMTVPLAGVMRYEQEQREKEAKRATQR